MSGAVLVGHDLLAYRILQSLDSVIDVFDLVIDLTEFSPANELSLHWFQRLLQLCPSSLSSLLNVRL